MQLKKSFLIALLVSVVGLISWEVYWRNQGYVPTIEDNKHLFSVERHKVNTLNNDDFVIVGSSRVLYNIQLDEFEKLTGKRPIQLAVAGSSPLPTFHDIVENTDFKGTVIIGVTPGLFFSTTLPTASPIKNPQSSVDHYQDRTLAQRFGHFLSMPLQKNLVLMADYSESNDENTDLKTLLKKVEINSRTDKPRYPPFFEFGQIAQDRNVRMTAITASDTAAANIIIDSWKFVLEGNKFEPDKNSTIAFIEKDAEKFTKRGGTILFVRSPSSGMFKDVEAKATPRERFYDSLLNVTNAKGYHYQDYPQLQSIDCCPEWSHLSAENADVFTRELVKIMQNDNLLPTIKN